MTCIQSQVGTMNDDVILFTWFQNDLHLNPGGDYEYHKMT